MEDARYAYGIGIKSEIGDVGNFGNYANLMPLCYTMHNLQGAVPELTFFWLSLVVPMDMITR